MRAFRFVAAVALLLAFAGFANVAVGDDDIVMIGKDKLWNAPRPELPDLSVQYISRTPRFPGLQPQYVNINDDVHGVGETGPVTLKNPDEQRWPKPGEEVTFTAVVRNSGTKPIKSFDWHWLYDGKDIESGRCEETLAPDATTVFHVKRPWQEGRHFITFQVDRDRLIEEICEENNWVIDATDAASYAFFVEESVREEFKKLRNGLGSYDWADWAQFQVRQSNKEFRDTIYPSCPDGITERVRLDAVYVIPDGWGHQQGMHTPNVVTPVNYDNPELVNANDPPKDKTSENFNNQNGGVDGVWGFTADLLKEIHGGKAFYRGQPRWLTSSEWPLHHELGHQLGRIDNYLIWSDKNDNPALPNVGYQPPRDFRDGMMHSGNYAHDNAIGKNQERWDSTYRFYSEHTARSLNRDLHVRRGLFGEYLFDVPKTNSFRFVDADGKIVPNAKVEVFVGRGRGYTGCGFNAEPNFTGKTDSAGVYSLDRRPWDHVFIWGNNGVVMFRVTPKSGEPLVGFRNVSHFNLAYWRGHEDHADFTVPVKPVSAAEEK